MDPATDQIESQVRNALTRHGRLTVDATDLHALRRDDDLAGLGLTSTASVNVMLAIEDDADVEFADTDLTRATFATVGSLVAVVARLVRART